MRQRLTFLLTRGYNSLVSVTGRQMDRLLLPVPVEKPLWQPLLQLRGSQPWRFLPLVGVDSAPTVRPHDPPSRSLAPAGDRVCYRTCCTQHLLTYDAPHQNLLPSISHRSMILNALSGQVRRVWPAIYHFRREDLDTCQVVPF